MDTITDLGARSGLPDALRILLEAFPRDSWEAHPNHSGLVAFWLERHLLFRRLCEAMRRDSGDMIDGRLGRDGMAPRLSRYGGMLVEQLHAHHRIEDMHYFPRLTPLDPRLSHGFDILDRDHNAMDGLLDSFTKDANALLRGQGEAGHFRAGLLSFERQLLRHLEDEEDLIVPVILKHGPEALE